MEKAKVGDIINYPKEQGIGILDETGQIIPCENPNEAKIFNMLFHIISKLNNLEKLNLKSKK